MADEKNMTDDVRRMLKKHTYFRNVAKQATPCRSKKMRLIDETVEIIDDLEEEAVLSWKNLGKCKHHETFNDVFKK